MENIAATHVYSYIELGGKQIPFITDAVVNMFVVTGVLIIAVILLSRNLRRVPTNGQSIAEITVEFINNLLKGQMGHHFKRFAPYILTLLLFIVFSNLIAIFNVIPSGSMLAKIFNNPSLEHFDYGLHPPTKNFNVTLCLAIITIIVVIVSEFKNVGFRGWLRSFYKPTPISAFIKILDYVVRPMSLCLRLFGNILGGYIVMTLIYNSFPAIVPAIVGIYFDLFDGGLQAYVFIFLACTYIAESVEAHE